MRIRGCCFFMNVTGSPAISHFASGTYAYLTKAHLHLPAVRWARWVPNILVSDFYYRCLLPLEPGKISTPPIIPCNLALYDWFRSSSGVFPACLPPVCTPHCSILLAVFSWGTTLFSGQVRHLTRTHSPPVGTADKHCTSRHPKNFFSGKRETKNLPPPTNFCI